MQILSSTSPAALVPQFVGFSWFTGGGSLTNWSRNQAGLLSSSVNFTCTTDTKKPLRWNFYEPTSAPIVHRLFTGYKNSEHADHHEVTFNQVTGTGTLTIEDLRLTDGGRYQCLELYSSENEMSLELIVLGYLSFFTSHVLDKVNYFNYQCYF